MSEINKTETETQPIGKPNNGWSFEHDELLSNWSDKAACYTWMHDATQRKFRKINMNLGIPVIVLSTISGTANFGISTIFPAGFNYGNAVIGTLSLITGVISTVSNFLGYAQSEEAHRIAGVQWSKFKRSIETELSINPNERKDASEFIKYSKAELDRLMEQSPTIPQDIIDKFIKTFRKVKDVKMPEICNKLEPTTIYSELYNARTNNVDNKIDALISATKHSETNTADKNIVISVSDKINKFANSSSPVPKNNENVIDDVILNINVPEETVIHYSNTMETNENKVVEQPEQPNVRRKILPKQMVYGKK